MKVGVPVISFPLAVVGATVTGVEVTTGSFAVLVGCLVLTGAAVGVVVTGVLLGAYVRPAVVGATVTGVPVGETVGVSVGAAVAGLAVPLNPWGDLFLRP